MTAAWRGQGAIKGVISTAGPQLWRDKPVDSSLREKGMSLAYIVQADWCQSVSLTVQSVLYWRVRLLVE